MKFIKIDVIAGEGGKSIIPLWLNPLQVVGVIKTGVPGSITGSDGEPVMVEKGALDLGIKLLATNHSVEELLKMLEKV